LTLSNPALIYAISLRLSFIEAKKPRNQPQFVIKHLLIDKIAL